ncbi:hypothetical protein D3C80_1333430 [compost metagenome]|jgi:hypothetical protein
MENLKNIFRRRDAQRVDGKPAVETIGKAEQSLPAGKQKRGDPDRPLHFSIPVDAIPEEAL